MAEVHLGVIGDVAPAQALQIEDAGVVGGRVVGDELGLLGVEDGYLVFERGEKQRRLAADELGDAVAGEEPAAVSGGIDAADEPFFVADDDAGAGGKREHHMNLGSSAGVGPCEQTVSRPGTPTPRPAVMCRPSRGRHAVIF